MKCVISTSLIKAMEKELLESAMRQHGRSECVERVISMEAEPALPKGENYLSTIYRITLKVVLRNGRQAKKSLILKVVPPDAASAEFIKEMGVFRIETKMYTNVLREMEMLMDEFGDSNGTLWCSLLHFEPYRSLLLEDLKVSGFRMTRRQDNLDLDHALLIFRSLARFHAIAKVLEQRGIVSKDDYKSYAIASDNKLVNFVMYPSLQLLAKVMEERWGPEWYDVAQKLKISREWLEEKMARLSDVDESKFNSLNHGDCWSNNVMFKYDWRNKPIAMRFVDWQVVHYNSPAYDLVYVMYASIIPQVRRDNYELLLRTYLDSMNSTFALYGFQDSTFPKLTMKELKSEIERIVILKMWSLVVINAAVTNDRNDVFDIGIAMKTQGKEGFHADLFNQNYQDRVGPDWKIIAHDVYELYRKECDPRGQ